MGDWQPIETAPKNGDRVLLYTKAPHDDFLEGVACFAYGRWEWDNGEEVEDEDRKATHWQPLPAPPPGDGSEA